ncbi:MAG TPA: ATP-dependent protease ATPase subunit HslU [Turneriella sp.]|nr:ATP-dependent protease ATPase subunit HslU [Turneriella sp.]HNA78173.1 ATP-dependent protease ATPase subunit HslU [Turneriella sp.]HNE18485.1 ATP-dependent protease ATPase subunit HslU [Turneriella sp.]HNL54802.1 ATP-dependent protease ATPase subunit HslU [Turneriella sp.]HNM99163.1 ATP-dependent protease ATPase subunit HslU [Turneriella sp.]
MLSDRKPADIVRYLDEFIIGQTEAKKAVAVALRNRERRLSLGEHPLREEIHPKNIIMIGPTGVGKTEIARRLARLANAPFIKVEATKYTEVGYVGRDVESMIRDLLMSAIKIVRSEHEERYKSEAEKRTEERLLDLMLSGKSETTAVGFQSAESSSTADEDEKIARDIFRKKLRAGQLEEREVELKLSQQPPQVAVQMMAVPGMEELENQMQNILGDIFPKKKEKRKITVGQARKLIYQEELDGLIDFEKIKEEAISRTENTGIVFIDEIDKIASRGSKGSPDVSREGVQRDILPLVEGSTVNTRHGSVKTDHILFIAAGAFHIASVTDLIPELQGRFPIRVELKPLVKEDYISILKTPKNALAKQYQALLSTENVNVVFESSGYEAIAEIAFEMNARNENIGARRLHTILERLFERVSFEPEKFTGGDVIVNRAFVEQELSEIVKNQDLSRFIL